MPVIRPSAVPQRVLLSADAIGGVWSYALDLARGLTSRGIAVRLAVLGPDPDDGQTAAAEAVNGLSLVPTGLPLEWTASTEAALEHCVAELKLLARQFDADLVHLHAPALAGSKRWTVPLVVSMHSCVGTWWCANRREPLPDDFAWRTRRASAGMAVADCTVAPSQSFASDVERLYGQGVIRSVLNGRRAAALPPADTEERVFTAGRLWDEGKNVAVIDEAARHSAWPVYAAGPTSGPNGARADASSLHLLGPLSEAQMADWYRTSPVFVSAARYEPFGLTVLEAAQAGAALVLSDIATFRELWDGAAFFVPVDDAGALADALNHLASQPNQRRRWAMQAGERARAYSLERMIAGTLAVYADVAAPLARAG